MAFRRALLLLACSILKDAIAFSPTNRLVAFRRGSRMLYSAPPSHTLPEGEMVQVTDVEEAVELIQQQQQEEEAVATEINGEQAEEGEPTVVIELPEVEDLDVDKEELLSEIEDILLQNNVTQARDIAGNIQGLIDSKRRSKSKVTAEEAAISASLYMNPYTEAIASHLTVTWEPQVAELLEKLSQARNPSRPLMVGVVGIPGSGKSTSADIVAKLLGDHALVMPMDGFHLSLEQLSMLPNSADAIYRRGAPDTFDPAALSAALDKIAYQTTTCSTVTIPGFDHAMGDPVPDQHTFDRNKHEIVLCEGIYLLHNDDGWEQIKSFFDWTIYIDADVDVCIERLKERNKCIPGYTPEEIETRCDIVDRKNAETSRDSAFKFASQIVKSGASTM